MYITCDRCKRVVTTDITTFLVTQRVTTFFKASFLLNFFSFDIFPGEMKKINLHEIRLHIGKLKNTWETQKTGILKFYEIFTIESIRPHHMG